MHNVVRSIIDIDKQANDRLEKAVNQAEEIIQKAKDETKKIKEKLNLDAIKRIEKTEAMHDKIAEEKIAKLKEEREKGTKKADKEC
jgi:V/A-type H+-transporting ATPase subunit G/H